MGWFLGLTEWNLCAQKIDDSDGGGTEAIVFRTLAGRFRCNLNKRDEVMIGRSVGGPPERNWIAYVSGGKGGGSPRVAFCSAVRGWRMERAVTRKNPMTRIG